MFYTYILQSQKTEKYYIGSTENLEERMIRHNGGRSKATKSGIPWALMYYEEYDTKSHAYQRELEFKAWNSHSRLTRLISASRFKDGRVVGSNHATPT